MLNDLDKAILNAVQEDFPIVPHPFAAIAKKLQIDENTLLARLNSLKNDGYLKRFGAFFDSKALGYEGTLLAMRVADEKMQDVAAAVNRYQGVTHNYERSGEYNLWFTLQTSSDEQKNKIIDEISSIPGVEKILDLEAEKTYKVRVRFQLK